MYTRTNPNIHITKCTCSLILRPKGRAETLQLKYSCQLLAVHIQYKHIDYTDIRQIKYKHIHILQIVVTKNTVLSIKCWIYAADIWKIHFCWIYIPLLNIFCQLLGDICHLEGFFPGAQLSGAQLSGGPTVRGPTVHFLRADNWAPGPNCPGPSCPGPNCPGPNCPGPKCLEPLIQSSTM